MATEIPADLLAADWEYKPTCEVHGGWPPEKEGKRACGAAAQWSATCRHCNRQVFVCNVHKVRLQTDPAVRPWACGAVGSYGVVLKFLPLVMH